jgi:hypothetical protein
LVWRGKEKLWARDPYTSGAGCEGRREEAEEMLTGDEELRAGGRQWRDSGIPRRRRVWERGESAGA